MEGKKYLIVNADDFGQNKEINRGIIHAHENGIVTSASLMVRWPAADEAAKYSKKNPNLSLGLHIDMGEWCYKNGNWEPMYEVVSLDDTLAVEGEVHRQLALFRCLMGKNPSHMDSHQHVHLRENIRPILVEIAQDIKVPLRQCNPQVRFCGEFYGQSSEGTTIPNMITAESLIRIISSLDPGITELACHPGEIGSLETMYRNERKEELKVLCDQRVHSAIKELNISLRSYDSIYIRSQFHNRVIIK